MIEIRFKKMMHTHQGQQCLDIDLSIEKGDFLTIFGPTGAGKTTFLRVLAGLSTPQEGYIELEGDVWFDSGKALNRPVQARGIAFVSQECTLFPNMTIRENLAYAAKDKTGGMGVDDWIRLTGLKGLEHQSPQKISGGQKQKAALARALISGPKLLLLDEPFSDLDNFSRLELQDELLKIYRQTGITTVLVSHDIAEVFKLSKKVLVLEHGRVSAAGSPAEILGSFDKDTRFKCMGEIIEIHKGANVHEVHLKVNGVVSRMTLNDQEAAGLGIGSKVIVVTQGLYR